MREILLLVIWGIIGIINFCSPKVSKADYGLCWTMLMLTLLMKVIAEG